MITSTGKRRPSREATGTQIEKQHCKPAEAMTAPMSDDEVNGRIREYLRAKNWSERLVVTSRLLERPNPETLALAGEMYLDMAALPDSKNPGKLIVKSVQALSGSIAQSETITANPHAAHSAMTLANMPLFRNLFVYGNNADQDSIRTALHGTICVGQQLSQAVRRLPANQEVGRTRGRLLGTLGECAVLALMQTDAVRNSRNGERMPLPATFSQDRGYQEKGQAPANFDIIELIQPDPSYEPEAVYHVQVKTGSVRKNPYAKKISLISIVDHLKLPEERPGTLPSFSIPDECAAAASLPYDSDIVPGELVAEDRLHRRSEQLFAELSNT
jgi:hypothetical protein